MSSAKQHRFQNESLFFSSVPLQLPSPSSFYRSKEHERKETGHVIGGLGNMDASYRIINDPLDGHEDPESRHGVVLFFRWWETRTPSSDGRREREGEEWYARDDATHGCSPPQIPQLRLGPAPASA